MALVDNAWYINGATTVAVTDLTSASNAAGATLTLSITVPAGALICVLVNELASTTSGSMSDATNGSYTAGPTQVLTGNVGIGQIYYFMNSAALSAVTLTYTKQTSGHTVSMTAFYATGIATTSALDTAVTASGQYTSATPSVTSGTPTQSDLMVGCCAWDNASALTLTNTAGYTVPFETNTGQPTAAVGGGVANIGGSIAMTYAPTMSGTCTGGAIMVIGFKPASASTGWWGVTQWTALTTKVCGNLVRQNATPSPGTGNGNERVFVCIASTAGTGATSATEPAWTVTRGAKITDTTVTWQEATGVAALNGDLTNTPKWNDVNIKNKAITLGQVIQNVAGNLILICTTAGTAGNGAEPSWAAFTNAGATTADNTVTWTTLGASFSVLAAPHARLQNSFVATWGQAANSFYIADNHAEVLYANNFITSPGASGTRCYVYSFDHTIGSTPPTTSQLKAGASITTEFSSGFGSKILLSGYAYCYGVTFNWCNVTGVSSIQNWLLDTCALVASNTGVTALGGTAGVASYVLLNNTTFSSPGGGALYGGTGKVVWKNTPSALGTVTTPLFTNINSAICDVLVTGVDLSAAGSGKTLVSATAAGLYFRFVDCKFGSGVTVAATPTQEGGPYTDVITSDSTGTNYNQQRYWYTGTLVPETTIIRTGGASDGTTGISWNVATTANSSWVDPFECFQGAIWNATTGANVTVTIYGIRKGVALPNNDQVWPEIEYFGSSSSPLGTINTGTKANNLATGSAWSADTTSDWTSQASSYQTAHAYGAFTGVIKAGNASPQQLWFMSSHSGTGTSGSDSTIFNGQADGAQVTDNSGGNQIVWQAMMRFSMAITLSAPQPQLAGPIYTTIKAAQASTTFYIDPKPSLGFLSAKSYIAAPGVYINELTGVMGARIFTGM